jgi:hypothetical protein
MRRDSLCEPRRSTILRALTVLALAPCTALLVARGDLGSGPSAQAQQAAYTLDENLPSFPGGVPSRSGVVELDPALAPLSQPSPAGPGTGRAAEPDTAGAAASPPAFRQRPCQSGRGAAPQSSPHLAIRDREAGRRRNDYRAFAPAFSDGHPGACQRQVRSPGAAAPAAVPGILPAPTGYDRG